MIHPKRFSNRIYQKSDLLTKVWLAFGKKAIYDYEKKKIMKFLVIGKDIGFSVPVPPGQLAGLLEGVYIPSFQMLEKWESEKKITGGFLAAQRGGAMIIEAASAEELAKTMTSLPFWGMLNWEVHPLQSFHSGTEDAKSNVTGLKQMASMQH
jgi:hypothetical protein